MTNNLKWFLAHVSQTIDHTFLVQATSREEALQNGSSLIDQNHLYADDAGLDVIWDVGEITESEAKKYKNDILFKKETP